MVKKPTRVKPAPLPPAAPLHPCDRLPPIPGRRYLNLRDIGNAFPNREASRFAWVLALTLGIAFIVWAALLLLTLAGAVNANLFTIIFILPGAVIALGLIASVIIFFFVPVWWVYIPSSHYYVLFNYGRQAVRILSAGHRYIKPAQTVCPFRDNRPLGFELHSETNPNRFPPIVNRDGFPFTLVGEIVFTFDPVAWAEYHGIEKLLTRTDQALIDDVKRMLFERARQIIAPCSLDQIWRDALGNLYRELERFFREKEAEGYTRIEWMLQIELPEPMASAQEIFAHLQAMGQRPSAELWIQLLSASKGRWKVGLQGGKSVDPSRLATPAPPQAQATQPEQPAQPVRAPGPTPPCDEAIDARGEIPARRAQPPAPDSDRPAARRRPDTLDDTQPFRPTDNSDDPPVARRPRR